MQHESHSCHSEPDKIDKLLWGSLILILAAFFCHYLGSAATFHPAVTGASQTVVELMAKMAWGLVFAVLLVGFFDFVPRSKFQQLLGSGEGLSGIFRATLAGVVLDLCSHGILLVAMKLYERGASLGQVVAFLVASPWNSFSMTLILWSLIGLKLTIVFIFASAVIAIVSGLIFQSLVRRGVLPQHPSPVNQQEFTQKEPWLVFPQNKSFVAIMGLMLSNSLHESRMILRWIFFGVLLTAVVKELVSPQHFQQFFGPDFYGVVLTLAVATVLEVCSEGSAPLASELVISAKAPGNALTFLMAGVSTDYTEIMALKETTRSWKVALFLPLITLPQIIIIGLIVNRAFG